MSLKQARTRDLPCESIKMLADYLNIRIYPRAKGIPTWGTTICKSFLAQKYTHPSDPSEWMVVVSPDSIGRLPYVIHRTPLGFADARWFYEIVLKLAKIIQDPKIGHPFSRKFNDHVNKTVAAQNFNAKMTVGQVRTISLFMKYVPGLTLCTTCFEVMLPRGGAGERWVHRGGDGTEVEVRLSAAKPLGLPGQTTEYVSHTITDYNNEARYALWDKSACAVQYTDKMDQEATHIPWEVYDYNKFSMGVHVCKCKHKNI